MDCTQFSSRKLRSSVCDTVAKRLKLGEYALDESKHDLLAES